MAPKQTNEIVLKRGDRKRDGTLRQRWKACAYERKAANHKTTLSQAAGKEAGPGIPRFPRHYAHKLAAAEPCSYARSLYFGDVLLVIPCLLSFSRPTAPAGEADEFSRSVYGRWSPEHRWCWCFRCEVSSHCLRDGDCIPPTGGKR